MQLTIKTKNIELDEPLEKFIATRVGKLDRFAKTLAKGETLAVTVEVEKVTTRRNKGDLFKAELLVRLPGKRLTAIAHGQEVRRAVLEAKDELEREIKKHKTKLIEAPRRREKKQKRV